MIAIFVAAPVLLVLFYLAAAIATGPKMDGDLSGKLTSEKTDRHREKKERERCMADLQDRLEAAEEELGRERNNQELADYLTDRIEEGTTLLNEGIEDDTEFMAWKFGVAAWKAGVLSAMRHHKCTKQEIQRVELLVLFNILPNLHSNPSINFEKSVHAARLMRVLEIAERYAVRPD